MYEIFTAYTRSFVGAKLYLMCRIASRDNHELVLLSLQNIKEKTPKNRLSFESLQPCLRVVNRNRDFFEHH